MPGAGSISFSRISPTAVLLNNGAGSSDGGWILRARMGHNRGLQAAVLDKYAVFLSDLSDLGVVAAL